MRLFITKKRLVKEFATRIAELNKQADKEYYKDNPPNKNENDRSSWLLDQSWALNKMCEKLGISKEVYAEAYKIYDFRNSGKEGYTLQNGVIVNLSASKYIDPTESA